MRTVEAINSSIVRPLFTMTGKQSKYKNHLQNLQNTLLAMFSYLGWHTTVDNYSNSLRQRRNRSDDISKYISTNENILISSKIPLKFIPIINIPALAQIMAWRGRGDKTLSEPKMTTLLTHICVTRPQCVNCNSVTCECCEYSSPQICQRNVRWTLYKLDSQSTPHMFCIDLLTIAISGYIRIWYMLQTNYQPRHMSTMIVFQLLPF